ncbi:hypothetical protein Leryth_011088 [Lithospermum erythrorhizon]|nr:hypothetical protein Leryth_011088 [Lithospermum erythrorhizon]
MDSWSQIQLKKMELGGNDNFNNFIFRYGIPKETDIIAKYNTKGAEVYRDRDSGSAEGNLKARQLINGFSGNKPPGSGSGGRSGVNGGNSGWDNWDSFDDGRNGNGGGGNTRRNQTDGDLRAGGGGGSVLGRSRVYLRDLY